MTILLLYALASIAAVLAFPRVWLAAILAGLLVAWAFWAWIESGGEDMAIPVIIMVTIAGLLFLAMLGAIVLRRRSTR
jgi:MYXO-CTERM domain-containing protein